MDIKDVSETSIKKIYDQTAEILGLLYKVL